MSTPHGDVETPMFMPVGTNATVKALDPDDLHEVGAQHHPVQHLPPRPAAGSRAHRAGWAACIGSWTGTARSSPTPVASRWSAWAPCGASTRTGRRSGRISTAPSSGSRPSTPSRSRRRSARTSRSASTSRCRPTRRAARRCSTRPPAPIAGRNAACAAHQRPDQALFGIIQGGLEADLRAESTRILAALPFDGLCIGGLAGDETPAQRRAALDVVVPLLADDPRPRYLMGLGSPMDLLDAVDAGVDLFDSVLPARVARNGTLWVPGGRLNLRNARFLDDPRPVQEGCRCRACRIVLTSLSGPPVPGRRAARLPAGDLSQPDLHPRLHGRDPGAHPRRDLPPTGPR